MIETSNKYFTYKKHNIVIRTSLAGMSLTCMVNSTAVALQHVQAEDSAHRRVEQPALAEYARHCAEFRQLNRGNVSGSTSSAGLNDYGVGFLKVDCI